ncbi:hypothetical protein VNO77_29993 [Canavalia gladiata]|uniref:Uncharacterized protein n=1 Tax=Canavalia gladiata TaxID=3824 RepID=A0AAN9KRE5_CANGL
MCLHERERETRGIVTSRLIPPCSSTSPYLIPPVKGVDTGVLLAWMGSGTLILSMTVRFEATNSDWLPPSRSPKSLPPFSLTKPSWVVRTESNVRKKRRKKPDPSCVDCEGSGRVDCPQCRGRGRINQVHLELLPKGEWPEWCRTCGGSGLSYCSRCLGTGEYRDVMGFRFLNMGNDQSQKNKS